MSDVADFFKKELGGRFVKLTDVPIKLCFVGKPIKRTSVFIDGKYLTYNAAVHHGQRPRETVLMNAFDVETGEMRIIDKTKAFWAEANSHLATDPEAFKKCVFACAQKGTGRSTRYTVDKAGEIDNELAALIKDAPLHDLEEMVLPPGARPAATIDPTDNIPF